MVVGNGMLAREFSSFEKNDKIIIFASGVSNSQEQDHTAFARELALLMTFNQQKKKLIYFSTISIYDPELINTAYIKHKLNIEEIITREFNEYIIFRLPQLVGKTENPYTLCNFLYNKIKNNETITVFENACRYLMDVSDVYSWLKPIIVSNDFDNSILDINFNNKITINELLDIFEKIISNKNKRIHVKKGGCYQTNNSKFLSHLSKINYIHNDDYSGYIIKKYYL